MLCSSTQSKTVSGWLIALIATIFLSLNTCPVEAGGAYSNAHGLSNKTPRVRAPSGPRVNHRAINRGNVGSRAGGSSSFGIDKSRLSKGKSKKKTTKKPVKKSAPKKQTAKRPSGKKKSGSKRKTTTKIITTATRKFDPAPSGNASPNAQPYDEFRETTTVFSTAQQLASTNVITGAPGVSLETQKKFETLRNLGSFLRENQSGLLNSLLIQGAGSAQSELDQLRGSDGQDNARNALDTSVDQVHGNAGIEEASALNELRGLGNGPAGAGPGGASAAVNMGGSAANVALGIISRGRSQAPPSKDPDGTGGKVSGGNYNAAMGAAWGRKNVPLRRTTEVVDFGGGFGAIETFTDKRTGQIQGVVRHYPHGETTSYFYDEDGNVVTSTFENSAGTSSVDYGPDDPQPQVEAPEETTEEDDQTTTEDTEETTEEDDQTTAVDTEEPGNRGLPTCIRGLDCLDGQDSFDAEQHARRRRAIVAAFTREWTGQPAPHEGGNADGWMSNDTIANHVAYFYGRKRASKDCWVARCNAEHDLNFASHSMHTVWDILHWHPQVAPQ